MARNSPFAARQQQAGISTVEFALTAMVFFMLLFGIIDFARIAWEFNAAAKAAQWGARFAAVKSKVVVPGLCTDYLALAGGNGRRVPLSVSDVVGPPVDPLIVTEMQKIYSRIIDANNVVVTYRHVGLGFAGNPIGPDIAPLVTVELQGIQFVPITPGLSLLPINLPRFATTMTAENLAC